MEIPSSWWISAEEKVFSLREVKEHFNTLLKNHSNPHRLLSYLNQRRFILLLQILEQSECLRKFLFRHPEVFEEAIPGLWYVSKEKQDFLSELENTVINNNFSEKLAYYRHRELLRIFAKELLKCAKPEDLLREYSSLADALVEIAYRRAFEEITEKYGYPLTEAGEKATAVVIGLGKLGSEELNYYSDIDLIFLHSADKGYAGKVSLNEFFSKVFKRLINLLSSQTIEGKPFEVDLDLRPFGKTGPLSMSLRSAELYYESYGRIWERFALLRARPVAGDQELGRRFVKEVVNPFVYASADYRLVEEIKLMKKRISAEAEKKLFKGYNVKSGEGGIREIEFTVQSLIILLGSKNPFLRERNTFRAIWKLNQKGIFSDEEATFLEKAYAFMRALEHRIQLRNCLQSHILTESEIPYLAKFLGYSSTEEFFAEFNFYRKGVKSIFEELIPEQKKEELQPIQIALITDDSNYGCFILKQKGFKDSRRSFALLESYIYGKEGFKLSDREREKLLKLIPRLIEIASRSSDPDETLKNFDKFFSNPTGRKVILSDPKEDFLEGLFRVFSLSSTLSSLVGRNPDLVEDVLTLYREYSNREKLEEEFIKYEETLKLSPENLFRRFKKVWEIRIGLVYMMGDRNFTNLISLFNSLSLLADFLLEKLWKRTDLDKEKAVLYSLGKLGSKELTFGSDLDLIFCSSENLKKEKLFSKVHRLVRFLTLHTAEGYLYDVDFRLRPMGSKGELIPSLEFYKSYFKREGRTWERLAWTRARFITGNTELREEMEKELHYFLFEKPWGEKERKEVYEMRMKLQDQARKGKDIIDIKFGKGGIVDGEFLVQYLLIKEKIRESSMIEGFKKLIVHYKILKPAYEAFMFLRMVETHLRLIKERGSSVIQNSDIPRLAKSLGMEGEDFVEELNRKRKILRDIFLEFLD